jgi:NAD(P)-dependent dehydrogenase (short-subunit alcohol dehydrogenase family)
MKVILIGANGTIGELVQKALAGAGHEIVKVGHKSGDFQVEIENRESVRKLYQAVGSFDAVAIAAGQVAFAPLSELTAEKWQFSLGSKLIGQITLVQEAIPFIKEKGSFTLVSGILNDDPIFAGAAGSTVSGALEGFVRAAAIELPKGLRIKCGEPHDAERVRISICPVLHRHDSGRRMESRTSLQTRHPGGANRPRLQS